MCVECDLAEPESLASLGGSEPRVVDGILSIVDRTDLPNQPVDILKKRIKGGKPQNSTMNCFISNHLISLYSHIHSMR